MTFVILLGLVMSGLKEFYNCSCLEKYNIGIVLYFLLLLSVNGLNPEVFLEWIDMIGLAKNEASLTEFKSLLRTFTKNSSKWNKAYAYHILNHHFEFISGEIKCYFPMDKERPEW